MLFVCRVFVALSRFTRTSTECIRLRRPLSIPHLRRRNWTPRVQPPPHSHRTLCSAQAATLGSGPPPVVPVSAAPSRPFPRSPSARFSSSLRPRAWSPRSSSMCPRTFLSYGCSVHTPSLIRHPAFVYPRNPAMLVMLLLQSQQHTPVHPLVSFGRAFTLKILFHADTSETPAHPPASDLGHAHFPPHPPRCLTHFLSFSSLPLRYILYFALFIAVPRTRSSFCIPFLCLAPTIHGLAPSPFSGSGLRPPTLVPLPLRTRSRSSFAPFPGSFPFAPPIGLPRPVVHPPSGY
ncbi:hypothetical protein VTO73DRAFT_9630 [Trametes versicolor]